MRVKRALSERTGWYFYDWANSAFYTSVVTVFLGPYLTSIAKAAADPRGFIHPFGIPVSAGAYFPYLVSLSVGLQVAILPVLGAIADYSHRKKQMLALFAYLGALAATLLFFVRGTNYPLGGALFVLANLSFGASIVFYNAFLPELAGPDERDAVSSKGWAIGYLGGGLLLGLHLLLVANVGRLGLTIEQAVRLALGSAGLWWALFTLLPLGALRPREPAKRLGPGEHYLAAGFRQLLRTLGEMRHRPHTLLFLCAYLFYNDGIQTVIALAAQFGQEAVGMPIPTITLLVLMVQFVAFFGALFFNRVAKLLGTKLAVIYSLLLWTASLVYIYGFVRSTLQFFIVGAVIGMVLGGSQALSRSIFSQLIPRGQESEYFSLYEVSERGTSWLGPLLFGLALQFTGSYRSAILSLIVFFVIGLALLVKVDVRKGALQAGNQPPGEA